MNLPKPTNDDDEDEDEEFFDAVDDFRFHDFISTTNEINPHQYPKRFAQRRNEDNDSKTIAGEIRYKTRFNRKENETNLTKSESTADLVDSVQLGSGAREEKNAESTVTNENHMKLVTRLAHWEPIQRKEMLNFDYPKNCPVALVTITSRDGAFCGVNYEEKKELSSGLGSPVHRKVQVTLKLTLPASDYNQKLGIFQVRVEFLSGNDEKLSSSSHPCMLQFKVNLSVMS